ncbi:hypothetical protein L873DRAFT_1279422 [Choiromyces venosus 120613-1]|uniref:Uncharacterized protein n=1 Tax=Choiromyces venosus 120613-1 TaxID=1336337 RepID=A0A3N4KFP5_9PEZI|nr:hypothetical protein L873DRAFT_1279422 [Choiromyces venosus 120613-1]
MHEVETALISEHISGDVLLLCGHDTDWFKRYFPTIGAPHRLSRLVRCLYATAGIPITTGIDPIPVTRVQGHDHSPANVDIVVYTSTTIHTHQATRIFEAGETCTQL